MSMVTKWVKYAIIADLAKKLKERGNNLGRTALQKFVYLLQELYNVDCGYEFKFYTYGPFSSEITGNLEMITAYDAVKVQPPDYSSGRSAYKIEPSAECDALLETASDFLAENEYKIVALLDVFGNKTAENLELYATVVWVDRSLHSDQNKGHTDIATLVHELKPKFEMEKVQEGIEFMSSLGFLLSVAS